MTTIEEIKALDKLIHSMKEVLVFLRTLTKDCQEIDQISSAAMMLTMTVIADHVKLVTARRTRLTSGIIVVDHI